LSAVLSAMVELETEKTEKELLQLRSAFPELVVQVVSARKPPGARAVEMIAAQTLRAMETGSLLAEKPEVDLLLRLAGTNQITVALKTNGYKGPGTKLLVAAGPRSKLEALRRKLSENSAYTIRTPRETRDGDLLAVETAALLGTRT
jgi:tRNA threonylcarbamoyladenosine modification (KEOPS) complex Cgi121 subunit